MIGMHVCIICIYALYSTESSASDLVYYIKGSIGLDLGHSAVQERNLKSKGQLTKNCDRGFWRLTTTVICVHLSRLRDKSCHGFTFIQSQCISNGQLVHILTLDAIRHSQVCCWLAVEHSVFPIWDCEPKHFGVFWSLDDIAIFHYQLLADLQRHSKEAQRTEGCI